MTKRISIIVAAGEDNAIGKGNTLPWHIPEDLEHFKQTTMGKPVVMGRKTYESIGRLLPGRQNIIITRNKDYSVDGAVMVNSIDEAIEVAEGYHVFVIGGANIYEQVLPNAHDIYLTKVKTTIPDADAYFPELDKSLWRSANVTHYNTCEHEFSIYYLLRKSLSVDEAPHDVIEAIKNAEYGQ